MSSHLLEQPLPKASRESAVPLRAECGHLALLDLEQVEPLDEPVSMPGLRRSRMDLYDIAVILLLFVSLAAIMACLMHMS